MTKAQRTAYKADNRARRALEVVLASKPDPRSRTSLRRKFERLHDEWRAAVGLEPHERQTICTGGTAGRGRERVVGPSGLLPGTASGPKPVF